MSICRPGVVMDLADTAGIGLGGGAVRVMERRMGTPSLGLLGKGLREMVRPGGSTEPVLVMNSVGIVGVLMC